MSRSHRSRAASQTARAVSNAPQAPRANLVQSLPAAVASVTPTLDAVQDGWGAESRSGGGFRATGRMGDGNLRADLIDDAEFASATLANGDADWSQPVGMDWMAQKAERGGLNAVDPQMPGAERPHEDVGTAIAEVVGDRTSGDEFTRAEVDDNGDVVLITDESIAFGE